MQIKSKSTNKVTWQAKLICWFTYYTITKLLASLYLVSHISEHVITAQVWDQIVSAQRCASCFYICCKRCFSYICCLTLTITIPMKSHLLSQCIITFITSGIKCNAPRIIFYTWQKAIWLQCLIICPYIDKLEGKQLNRN